MSTRCLILAQSNLNRAAWHALLEKQPGIVVVGAVPHLGPPAKALELAEVATILVDMPAVTADFIQHLQSTVSETGLLFLVDSYELQDIVSMLRAGATGFISRDATVGDLARAIIAAGRGELVLPPDLATRALLALTRGEFSPRGRAADLTDREQEVLGLLARGLTNKDIAQTLIVSVRTVEAHLRNIYGKLKVGSRTEAAVWAVNHGYASETASQEVGDST